MRVGLASVRVGGLDEVDQAVRRLQEECSYGRDGLDVVCDSLGPDAPVEVIAALVKAELGRRYALGEHPAVADYLDRFPALRGDSDRVLSLVYEEFCLREEAGERLDPSEFCARYGEWKDSLESQLKYHRVISQVVGPKPAPPRFPAHGDRFVQFTIGAELGRGGAARVYQARDNSLGGRDVVLKVSADRGSEPAILGRLEHPHIITVHTVAVAPETSLRGLCMPHRPGLPLDTVITRVAPARRPRKARALWKALVDPSPAPGAPDGATPGGPGWDGFPADGRYADGVAWVVAKLADALAYTHSQNVYHRDVKPANVLLTYRDGPQLLDFNLSHDPDSAEQAAAALRGGTLPYMAPEQLEAFLDPARWGSVLGPADIYSLGLLTRELLTGEGPDAPRQGLTLPRAISALIDRRRDFRPRLRRLNPRIPEALDAIVERSLSFDPAGRYQDPAELAEDLRRYLARRPLRHAANRSQRERLGNWAARNRGRLKVALAAAAVVALAVAAPPAYQRFDYWRQPVENRPSFQEAVHDLDGHKADAAVAALNAFPESARRRPLVAFYHAAALARINSVAAALAAFELGCAEPRTDEALFDWARTHPTLAEHAETLGAQLLSLFGRRDRAGHDAGLASAWRMFALALRVDPRRVVARTGQAAMLESRGEYPSARRTLGEVIAEFGTEPPADPSGCRALRNLLVQRGRCTLGWAGRLLKTRSDPGEALARVVETVADLDRADALPDPPSDDPAMTRLGREKALLDLAKSRFDRNGLRCEAYLIMADVAARRGEPVEALRLARKAEALLPRLEAHASDQDRYFQDVRKRARSRVESLAGDSGDSAAAHVAGSDRH